MSNRRIVEGFSVTNALILDGVTDAYSIPNQTFADIYGVSNASIAPDVGNFENTGDDTVLSVWNFFNFATLTVESGYIPFDTISVMTGDSYTSSGSAPNDWFMSDLWTEASMNVAPKPVLIRTLSRDADGNPRTLDFLYYKVQFAPISFNGPQYHQGLRVNWSGRVLMSSADETGTALSKRKVGRLISRSFLST